MLTLIEEVVALLFQMYVEAPLADIVTDPPRHAVNGPEAAAETIGNGLTVVTVDAGADIHPMLVPVALYVPAVDTVIVEVVAPLLQI